MNAPNKSDILPNAVPSTDAFDGTGREKMKPEPPTEDKHPGLQPTLVFLTYPIALVAIILFFSFIYWIRTPKHQAAPGDIPTSQIQAK
jgi:hypothetical protein